MALKGSGLRPLRLYDLGESQGEVECCFGLCCESPHAVWKGYCDLRSVTKYAAMHCSCASFYFRNRTSWKERFHDFK